MPTVTNTNVAGLCCGVHADEHGITGNSYWDVESDQELFMSDGNLLTAATLFQRAARSGVRSALISAKQKTIPLLRQGTALAVGNDPTWQDGGPNGRYRDYWHSYAFGDLTESAKTRRQVLERLLPRLKIAPRCSLSEKFLVVRGDVRTYKIHLGSGNILMSPNDQYLCIVPKQTDSKTGDVFLPFEGDRTLSVIISKAFLLAADSKIIDPTILTQIQQK